MTHTLEIEVSDEFLAGVNQDLPEFAREARLLIAAKLYELGRITSGQAAEFAGLGRVAFLLALPGLGVPTSNLTAEDATDEIAYARRP